MKNTNKSALSSLPVTNAQPFGLFDCTPIRAVIIDPYNQEIRQAKMARGLFEFDIADGGCVELRANLTRTSELHIYRGGDGLALLCNPANAHLSRTWREAPVRRHVVNDVVFGLVHTRKCGMT